MIQPFSVNTAAGTNDPGSAVSAPGATKTVRVLGFGFTSAGVCDVSLLAGSGGSVVAGPYRLSAEGGILERRFTQGLQLAQGTGLFLSLSAGVQVSGDIEYEKF